MAKKKHPTIAAPPWPVLRSRAQKAIRDGRFQQALDLAKQVHEAEPTAANLELLRQAYFGRAKELRIQGQTTDALTVLHAALEVDQAGPPWLQQIAEELARCGEVKQALELLAQAPDETAQARVLAGAADAAMQREAGGRSLLPESLRADFDRILLAFRQTEAGQDDEARATLQSIGLRSPFLEWKLLLRGLLAFYEDDDARALENWQRLAPDRLPARLAAPFRFKIDAEFRAAQAPESHAALERLLDRLEEPKSLLPQLRKLRGLLTNQESLAAAFRQAEKLLPALRRDAPHLEARLASCFYWATVHTGPDDVLRYKRVFGRPPDDPHFYRLEALANEPEISPKEAHKNWQKFEKEIAGNPKAWPAGQAERARALIWLRMGRNAAGVPNEKDLARLPAFLRDHPDRPRPLSPSAEECYGRALDLQPDLLEAHEGLIALHRRAGENAKAEAAARRRLEVTPDHATTLEALSGLLLERDEVQEALQLLQRAAKANPLNRELRSKLAAVHLLAARSYSLMDRFDEARLEYQAGLNLQEPTEAYIIQGCWAASEYRAGRTERAEELLEQAKAKAPSALAFAYLMLAESTRMRLHRTIKGRFEKEFKAGLEEPPTAAAATSLVVFARSLMNVKVAYHGQKAQAKKVLDYAERAVRADFTERQMEQICTALVDLHSTRPARRFLDAAMNRFSANPLFPYLYADTYLCGDAARAPIWEVKPLLEKALRLAEAMPPDARRDKLLHDIQERINTLAAANPFGMGAMPDVFGRLFNDWDDD